MFYEYDLPLSVDADGVVLKIRNECEHRLVLECIHILNDSSLPMECRQYCAFVKFYENFEKAETEKQQVIALEEMLRIIGGMTKSEYKQSSAKNTNAPPVVNWDKDYKFIAPATSKILGYDIRTPGKYTHWWTFVGAYMETRGSYFNDIVAIRIKKQKNKPLDKWEQEFLREHHEDIILSTLTEEEEAWLNSEW